MVKIGDNSKVYNASDYPEPKSAEEIVNELLYATNGDYAEAFRMWMAELNRGELAYALDQAFLALVEIKGIKNAFIDLVRSVMKMG